MILLKSVARKFGLVYVLTHYSETVKSVLNFVTYY